MSEKKIEPTDAMVTSAHSAAVGRLMTDPMTYRRILRAALNHPDARGLFTDEDDRPWEPLSGLPRVGDEVRRETDGTWYVRRAAPDLPTEDGAVIVPADGHEVITMVGAGGWAFDRLTYSAEHDRWYGMTKRGAIAMCLAEQITPGTWKVDDE